MKNVILSGGNYGGQVVEIEDNQTLIKMLDESNGTWYYDTSKSAIKAGSVTDADGTEVTYENEAVFLGQNLPVATNADSSANVSLEVAVPKKKWLFF